MSYFGEFGLEQTTTGTLPPGAPPPPPPLPPGMTASMSGALPGMFAAESQRSMALAPNWQYDPAVIYAMQTNPGLVQSASLLDTDSFRYFACQVIVALNLIDPAQPNKADAAIHALASAWAYYESKIYPAYGSLQENTAKAHVVMMIGWLVDDCNAMRDWAAYSPTRAILKKAKAPLVATQGRGKIGYKPGYVPPPKTGAPAPGTPGAAAPPAAASSSSSLMIVAAVGAVGGLGYLMYSRGMF